MLSFMTLTQWKLSTLSKHNNAIFDKHVQYIAQMDVLKWPEFVYTKESSEIYS